MKSFFSILVLFAASLSLAGSAVGQDAQENTNCGGEGKDGVLSVVGVQGSGVQLRLELRELEKKPEMWNLFLQSFAKFQAKDQRDKMSYFQISAIHGAPFVTWDGVQPLNASGTQEMGYCPHTSNMFATWHRPYLTLFEQALQDTAVEIANQFPQGEVREKYQDAARKLRLPYWDWAINPPNAKEGAMPDCLRRPNAAITYPNGTKGEIPNPLLQYNFHQLNPADFASLNQFQYKFSEWKTTIRNPKDGYASNATSRNDEVNKRVTSQQPNNRDMLYDLLTVYQPFNQWSSKSGGGKIGNIETLHDGIHNSFGLGHMGLVDVAAFDPAFWFHHCNVDRIVAMYQHRYPDTYVEPEKQVKATYTTPMGIVKNVTSPLAPFHMNAEGEMWTSQWVRNWESFGYTYPELQDNPSNRTLNQRINRLYKPAAKGLKDSRSSRIKRQDAGAANATDWMAEVKMPSDIQITYSVRAFLGPPSQDPDNWATEPNYVGQVASLASPKSNSDVIVTANIGLTRRLKEKFDKGELKSLEKAEVEAYLEKNFFWRIQAIDNRVIPRGRAPKGLNVTVLSVPLNVPDSDFEVPERKGNFEYKPAIRGRPPPAAPDGSEPEPPAPASSNVPESSTAPASTTTPEAITLTSTVVSVVTVVAE